MCVSNFVCVYVYIYIADKNIIPVVSSASLVAFALLNAVFTSD